jgi:hypothetical protein
MRIANASLVSYNCKAVRAAGRHDKTQTLRFTWH